MVGFLSDTLSLSSFKLLCQNATCQGLVSHRNFHPTVLDTGNLKTEVPAGSAPRARSLQMASSHNNFT